MKTRPLTALGLLMFATTAIGAPLPDLDSPDGRLRIELSLRDGVLHYAVLHQEQPLLDPSPLGLTFKDHGPLRDLRLRGHATTAHDGTWRPVWGRAAEVRDHHRELAVHLREASPPHRQLTVRFRTFDDGVAFRYELPAQPAVRDFAIMSEDTEWRLTGDPVAWWIPADEFAYESLHRETPLSETVHINTPVTLRTTGGLWMSLHEAALIDYSELTLRRTGGAVLRAHLWPWPDGEAVKGSTPFTTPWRTIMVSPRLGALAESHLIENLNDPCVLEDTAFIEPMTFIGIWWGLHTGRWTWHAGPRHGATTERALQYLDFAARHGLGGVLVEGWNLGWDTWGHGESVQDYRMPYPDFDLEAVARAAQARGVRLIGHHETGGNIPMYEAQLEDAFALCVRLGITSVKTGYAGPIRPEGQHHHGQFMVRHFQRVVETAARHRVTLNVHEGIKPTGLERTWPNLMCTEAVRGTEWNATLNTIPPRHSTVLPFTRLLAGPADVTPGIFHLDHAPERGRRVLATLANQLALYVVLHSPLMMLADLVEHYEDHPAFRFLQQVPVTWDETRVLGAEMGRHATFARRSGQDWYVGSVTDQEARLLAIPLDFLDPQLDYLAEVYADAADTDWEHDPGAIAIERYRASATDTLQAALSRAGGLALRLTPTDLADLPALTNASATAPERLMRFASLRIPGDLRVAHLAAGAAVRLEHPPSPRYDQGALTDGRLAGGGFQDPAWLGFEEVDLVATVDLGRAQEVQEVVLRVLQDPVNWIQPPRLVMVETSLDGLGFAAAARLEPMATGDVQIQELRLDLSPAQVRYLRVAAQQRPLPQGHPGQGQAGWLFCDEIVVR